MAATRNGNAKRFVEGEGAGGVGHLFVDFVGRTDPSREVYHIITVFLFNSADTAGVKGGFQFEIDAVAFNVRGSGGAIDNMRIQGR